MVSRAESTMPSKVPSLKEIALRTHVRNNPDNSENMKRDEIINEAARRFVIDAMFPKTPAPLTTPRVLPLRELALREHLQNNPENILENELINTSFQIVSEAAAPFLSSNEYEQCFRRKDAGALSAKIFSNHATRGEDPFIRPSDSFAFLWAKVIQDEGEKEIAILKGSDEEILRLLQKMPRPISDECRISGLERALEENRPKIRNALIEGSSDPERFRGEALIHAASLENSIADIRSLLYRGSIPTEYLAIALFRSLERQDFESAKAILIVSKNPNFLQTAIKTAITLKQVGIVREFLAIGEISDDFRKEALLDALVGNQKEIVQALVAAAPDPGSFRKIAIRKAMVWDEELSMTYDSSPLAPALYFRGKGNVIRYLLGNGPVSDSFRETMIMHALREGQSEIVQAFITTAPNSDRFRELVIANAIEETGSSSQEKIACSLLMRGQVSDSFRKQAYDRALEKGKLDIANALLSTAPNPSQIAKEWTFSSNNGNEPLKRLEGTHLLTANGRHLLSKTLPIITVCSAAATALMAMYFLMTSEESE